jgi:hypothetical protein
MGRTIAEWAEIIKREGDVSRLADYILKDLYYYSPRQERRYEEDRKSLENCLRALINVKT